MTMDRQPKKYNRGRTITWIIVLVLAGVVLGTYLTRRAQSSAESTSTSTSTSGPAWSEILAAPACALPVIVLTLIVLIFAAVQGYYGVQRLEAQRRLQAAEAAEREEVVRMRAVQTQRHLRELNDLTINLATGEEVARLVKSPDGEWLLVRPGLATKPVSRIDPDEVREDSDQVRVAAMLSNAARYGRSGHAASGSGQSNLNLELAALAMLNGGGSPDRRLPGSIQILTDDEGQMLGDKRND